jgi:hypothetical protein
MQDTQKIQIIQDFVKFCYYELGIKKSPKINIINDKNRGKKNNHALSSEIRNHKHGTIFP